MAIWPPAQGTEAALAMHLVAARGSAGSLNPNMPALTAMVAALSATLPFVAALTAPGLEVADGSPLFCSFLEKKQSVENLR